MRELSAKLTEGEIIDSRIIVFFSLPPAKIKDFAHLPHQREALVR